MQSLLIIQFEPIIGGESTLCRALKSVLSSYEITVIHPFADKVSSVWKEGKTGEFKSLSQSIQLIKKNDVILFLNSTHYKDSMNLLRDFYPKLKNKNIIFYEHGLHTWTQCNYESIFKLLSKYNKLRVLTNTNEAISFYREKGYQSFLCRQPFVPSEYNQINKNQSSELQICFNSRFVKNKGVFDALNYFFEFFTMPDLNFSLNFRAKKVEAEGLSIPRVSVKPYVENISEIYEAQDYVLYYGYDDPNEMGKLEYSVLEAIYYNLPIIAHPKFIRNFKCTEYGVSKDHVQKMFFKMTPFSMLDVLINKPDLSIYAEEAKVLLNDFLPEQIRYRVYLCVSSFDI